MSQVLERGAGAVRRIDTAHLTAGLTVVAFYGIVGCVATAAVRLLGAAVSRARSRG